MHHEEDANKKCKILKLKQLGQKPEKVQEGADKWKLTLGHNNAEDRDPKGAARMRR